MRWVPVVDLTTGITCLIPEPSYRHLQSLGAEAAMRFSLPPLSPPPMEAVNSDWSLPRTLDEWSDAFEVSPTTIGRWFRNGQVQAKRRGRLWSVAARDVPRPTTKRH